MRVAIAGGGTGGHLSVAKSFLESFVNMGHECIFVGSINGQDKLYFEEEDRFVDRYFLETSGIVNKKGIKKIKSMFMHIISIKQSMEILKSNNIECVISVGGYSAAPASFGAILLGIPLIIHEQNAKIGRLNRLLKPYSRLFFSSYIDTSPYKFYPVGEKFFSNARARSSINSILFMGGSQGAKAINNFALSLVGDLKNRGIKVYHQCGTNDFDRVFSEYNSMNINVKAIFDNNIEGDFDVGIFGFNKNMPLIYKNCDFAVCRSGASSLWELCANGLPALFVPYPYAAGDHQFYNAKFLEDMNLGFVCREEDLFCDVLWSVIDNISENINHISKELMNLCRLKASNEVVCMIEKEIKRN